MVQKIINSPVLWSYSVYSQTGLTTDVTSQKYAILQWRVAYFEENEFSEVRCVN